MLLTKPHCSTISPTEHSERISSSSARFHPLFKKKPDGRKLIEFSPFTVKSAAAETILFHQSSQVDFFVQVRCQPGSDVMDFQIDPVPFFCPRPELNQKLGKQPDRQLVETVRRAGAVKVFQFQPYFFNDVFHGFRDPDAVHAVQPKIAERFGAGGVIGKENLVMLSCLNGLEHSTGPDDSQVVLAGGVDQSPR